MDVDAVRRALGRPATSARYDLKPDESHWEWRFQDGTSPKVFVVTFDRDGKVKSTAIQDDPREVSKAA
jgi:hypothetical protein